MFAVRFGPTLLRLAMLPVSLYRFIVRYTKIVLSFRLVELANRYPVAIFQTTTQNAISLLRLNSMFNIFVRFPLKSYLSNSTYVSRNNEPQKILWPKPHRTSANNRPKKNVPLLNYSISKIHSIIDIIVGHISSDPNTIDSVPQKQSLRKRRHLGH